MHRLGPDRHQCERPRGILAEDGIVTERRLVTRRARCAAVLGSRPPARLVARHMVGTITTDVVLATLPSFRRHSGRPLLLVWDRLNAPVAWPTQDFLAAHPVDDAAASRPGYAPEFHPEEQCNRQVKHTLLNALPADVGERRAQARRAFRRLGRRPDLLAHVFAHAGLRRT